MAYVNFTLNEIWDFSSSAGDISSQIDNEVSSYQSAVSAAVSKYEAAIDVYEKSIDAMLIDRWEIEIIIPSNEKAIEGIRRRRDECKHVMDRSTEETRQAAKKAYNEAQQELEDAIRLNDELRRMKDRLWQRIEEMRQSVRNCQDAISTLQNNAKEMEKAGDNAKANISKVVQAADTAHSYGEVIIDNLNEGVSTYHSDIRVKLLDHNVILYISDALRDISKMLDGKTEAVEEANSQLEYCMSDKITRAAIAKMREIQSDSSGACGSFREMAKKSARAYDYIIDYLNLRMNCR